jgi:D-serine deaminase-like pyridoxal phosphate-dependent protein
MNRTYCIKEEDAISSPALIYYKDLIIENTKQAIKIAGSVERLWPHVKSHKMAAMVRLQQSMGINKFKCATIAEAEMLAREKAEKVVLAYPLVGPNIDRFVRLASTFPETEFFAIGDDISQIHLLANKADAHNMIINLLVDVDMGMNRTGVSLTELVDFYASCNEFKGISPRGLHCYDGNHNNPDYKIRCMEVKAADLQVADCVKQIKASHMDCSILIMGGTPSFPCHAELTDYYVSPGTIFLYDHGYKTNLPDLPITPAAAVLTRVISHPASGVFTLDLGYKSIAADPRVCRGEIQNLDNAEELFQNEEHWVFRMKKGFEKDVPSIGTILYVVPTHICPTSALYPSVFVAENGKIVDTWEVTARNRKITI